MEFNRWLEGQLKMSVGDVLLLIDRAHWGGIFLTYYRILRNTKTCEIQKLRAKMAMIWMALNNPCMRHDMDKFVEKIGLKHGGINLHYINSRVHGLISRI